MAKPVCFQDGSGASVPLPHCERHSRHVRQCNACRAAAQNVYQAVRGLNRGSTPKHDSEGPHQGHKKEQK